MPDTPTNPDVRYERSDASAGVVVGFVGAMIVIAIVLHYVLVSLFAHLRAVPVERTLLPASPRLEGLDKMEKRPVDMGPSHADLDDYEWVDRKQGLVRVPIRRAMEVLAGKHLGENHAAEAKEATGHEP